MAARGYITMMGAGLVWIGLICQLIPCCQLLRELSFCVEVDDSLCILLVIMNSFVLAACFTLLTLGLVWSDTRGFASLIFLSLCILGVLTIFGGALSVIIWGALTMAALWLYFSYLPSLYQDLKDPDNPNNGSYPRWLQDAGDFAIETELEKFGDTFLCFGQGAV